MIGKIYAQADIRPQTLFVLFYSLYLFFVTYYLYCICIFLILIFFTFFSGGHGSGSSQCLELWGRSWIRCRLKEGKKRRLFHNVDGRRRSFIIWLSSYQLFLHNIAADKSIAWDEHWIDVYELSEIIMKRTVKEFMVK